MSETLAIAVAQPVSVLHDIVGNAERHAAAIENSAARVVVFPELSLTGYAMDAQPVSEDDRRLTPIVDACTVTDTVALIGAPTRGTDGRSRISMIRVDSEAVTTVYDKIWLGGDEPNHFAAGRQPRVTVVDGWRLGLAICKDTGVPDHARSTAALGIDAYVAGVCEAERDRDVQPERAARMIQNHPVWVAIASFAGATGGGFDETAGRSAVWRPNGTTAVMLDREAGQVAHATASR
jgi:predicted amidohydrolase